ncbi:alpha-1,2-fucosyltransferase [Candidatus Nomurabacteria bacterium]|nr:alpha-1,2-fucosyltransferase [Candidatus Nomurabacteria bacterium]
MIIVRLSGGMGNQMFQYAIGRALSIRHNVPLKLDTTFLNHRIKMPHFLRPNFNFRNFDLDVFNIQAEIAQPSEISFWNRPILSGPVMLVIDAILRKLAFIPGWEKGPFFDKSILDLGPNTYLQGFWQSQKYFIDIASQIRKDFTLKDPISQATKNMQLEINNTESLCVHLRRTHGGGGYHSKYDMDYYNKGIKYISEKKKIEKIFVFSDDIVWCKENIKFDYPTIFVDRDCEGKKGEGDLFLMSQCKNFVIPNSTFSWWGAWLSESRDKIVVTPKDWYANSKINTDDLIPESWVRI